MPDFKLKRIGMVMEPISGDPKEVGGTFNPAVIRSRDGELYLFPRLVAKGNYSRIGIARVLFDGAGDPTGVERMGIVLEPEANYELSANGGGCEDPRITYFEALQRYVMTYTALSQHGPRIAVAISENLFTWRRLGLVHFKSFHGIDFDEVDDKDCGAFPVSIPDPYGRPSFALVHRPLFPGTLPNDKAGQPASAVAKVYPECMWISYCLASSTGEEHHLREFVSHRRLACPVADWERLKIGGGTPPVICRHGWLLLYHGVHSLPQADREAPKLCYSAGAMVLFREHPNRIAYRSTDPVLVPQGTLEVNGVVDDVVFPTGIDRRDDLGTPDRFDIYYGMADYRIGVARLDVPEKLPRNVPVACRYSALNGLCKSP